ncbi:MAG TPA: 2-isopropylmalate synthase [Streptosporangiaceae bacterium]
MDSYRRYSPFHRIDLPDRTWPDRVVTRAPRWLSTDLRDGNQALAEPMSPSHKLMMFELLTGMGYKEIEIGFPAASQDDYDFVRLLIEDDRIPDDVRITVGVPARDELIERTVESLTGARRATVCIYNATAPLFRRLVFGIDRAECKDLAVKGTRWMLKYAEAHLGDCDLGYEYTPEIFNETEPEFALEVCEAVMDVWQPEPGRESVLNFPSTVERSGPHMFADQIEWMHRHLSRREHICLSVHPHNDRGTAVATAELAVAAGADRVEGCLFGNGERTGNVCLVTLGMNLFSQGIDPEIDFSDLNKIRSTVEFCTKIPVHPRHPYGGDLVYTAFAGSHQDAINKGFESLARTAARSGMSPSAERWEVPYLPIDPRDIGRTYEAIVRVNSQSGKGGVAYVMRTWHGLTLPYGLKADFAKVVQVHSEALGGEVRPALMWRIFAGEYLRDEQPGERPAEWPEEVATLIVSASLFVDRRTRTDSDRAAADRAAKIEAALLARNVDARVVSTDGSDGEPATPGTAVAEWAADTFAVYAECRVPGAPEPTWGVGLDRDVVVAAEAAVRSAAARAARRVAAESAA